MLPSDLRQAEAQALTALQSALAVEGRGRWTVELRFEGLKVLPLALRLAPALREGHPGLKVLFPDAGATALARRDGGDLAPLIRSLGDHRRCQDAGDDGDAMLLVVQPGPSDYELVEAVCEAQRGPVVLLNPTLEDAAVGIGSVARGRRGGAGKPDPEDRRPGGAGGVELPLQRQCHQPRRRRPLLRCPSSLAS